MLPSALLAGLSLAGLVTSAEPGILFPSHNRPGPSPASLRNTHFDLLTSPMKNLLVARQSSGCPSGSSVCSSTTCCPTGYDCCSDGGCCAPGDVCDLGGCCPRGESCIPGGDPDCVDPGYARCSGDSFCCPLGNHCFRDDNNKPSCKGGGTIGPIVGGPPPPPAPAPKPSTKPSKASTTKIPTSTHDSFTFSDTFTDFPSTSPIPIPSITGPSAGTFSPLPSSFSFSSPSISDPATISNGGQAGTQVPSTSGANAIGVSCMLNAAMGGMVLLVTITLSY